MADKYEAMARELWQSGALTDTAGPLGAVTAVQSLAAALRAAAEEEREACANAVRNLRDEKEELVKRNALLSVVERIIRARGEVGK